VTFADAAAEWLHHLEKVKGREASTLRDYRGAINGHLKRFKDRPIACIKATDVEELRETSCKTASRHARSSDN
jgi:hypothetical protein